MLSTDPSLRITAYRITSPSTCSAASVGGYFGSTFRNGDGSAISAAELVCGPVGGVRISEKFRIQLPVALFRFGMFTFIEYTRRRAKMASGFAFGASAAKFGGVVRAGSSGTLLASARE